MIKNAFLLFIVVGLSLQASAQKIFKNEAYGFSMQEPSGWSKELTRKSYFSLDNNEGRNIVTFYKHEDKKRTEGTCSINVTVKSINSKADKLTKKMLDTSKWNESYYLDYSFDKKPVLIKIDNKTAIIGTINFRYNSHSGEKSFKKSICYIISGEKLFKIAFIVGEANKDEIKVFDDLIQSIKISA